jgi:hypothetical protein
MRAWGSDRFVSGTNICSEKRFIAMATKVMYLLGENLAPANGSSRTSHPLELVLLEHRVECLIGKNKVVKDLYAK